MTDFCVIVHAGAGYHSKRKESEYSKLCVDACLKAAEVLQQSSCQSAAINAASCAVSILEDSPLSNAGYGSNLTVDGTIECDAGIMCGANLRFSAVGSMSEIKNPIKVAEHLLLSQIAHPTTKLGRIFPSVLVGAGATKYAVETANFSKVSQEDLMSPSASASWKKFKSWLEFSSDKQNDKESSDYCISDPFQPAKRQRLDTVGAVCIDSSGRVASALSSGGIAMKCPGRLGQACIYGAGGWAECQIDSNNKIVRSVGIASSGTGEQLVRTQLSQRCAVRLLHENGPIPVVLGDTLSSDFLNSPYLRGETSERFAGVVGCLWSMCESSSFDYDTNNSNAHLESNDINTRNKHNGSQLEVFYGHTTQSMSIAYFVGDGCMKAPKTFISRKPVDRTYTIGAQSFRLSSC